MASAFACFAPALLIAQRPGESKVVRVRVLDVRTNSAVPGVELFALKGTLVARGDTAGVIQVPLPGTAPFEGELRKVGYVASSVHLTGREAGDSAVVLLAPASAQTLGAVAVTESAPILRYADFGRRMKSGRPGIFLTENEIAKGGHIRLTDLFRRFPSLKVMNEGNKVLVVSSRSKKSFFPMSKQDIADLGPCIFQVRLDDVRMELGYDMDELSREDIHGIEVYSGPASIPADYASMNDGWCGLILLWTKVR
jgi:hypothetical protein